MITAKVKTRNLTTKQ